MRKTLVLAEQVADFTCTNTDITGRNIGIGANVMVELSHKGLAEPHHLTVRFTLGIEV